MNSNLLSVVLGARRRPFAFLSQAHSLRRALSTTTSTATSSVTSSPLQGLTLVQECHDPNKSKVSKIRSFFGLGKANFGPALELGDGHEGGRASISAVPAGPGGVSSDNGSESASGTGNGTGSGADNRRASAREAAQELSSRIVRYLLPEGYPSSVPPHYVGYAKYQSLAMSLSSAAGVLATQSLFYAMGLGAGSIPFAAALNWVIKDGVGQLGGVLFASLVSRRFDAGALGSGPCLEGERVLDEGDNRETRAE